MTSKNAKDFLEKINGKRDLGTDKAVARFFEVMDDPPGCATYRKLSDKPAIRKRLKEAGIRQVDAANLIGITHNKLVGMLNGYAALTDEVLRKLNVICDIAEGKRRM